MFVGGEFYPDPRWVRAEPQLHTTGLYFLNGGRACLTVIAAALRARGVRRILLPSYLCPSIPKTLRACGLPTAFYRVRADLSLDLEDIARQQSRAQALYFINYFGFAHPPAVRAFMQDYQRSGGWVVEDNAQAGFLEPSVGDFVFNSLRKLCAHDGAYLHSRVDLAPLLASFPPVPNPRLPLIRAYRQGLYAYQVEHRGSHARLRALYRQAERLYERLPVIHGDAQERCEIEHLDWAGLRQARRSNYKTLLDLLNSIPQAVPVFPQLQADTLPLGLPVYLPRGLRDRVYEALGQAGVGAVIHWPPHARADPHTRAAAERMLTLPVDERAGRKHMEYVALQLSRALAGV